MPQSWRTALLRHHKTERRGKNNDKTNATYEITNARTKKICNWGTTLERSEKSTGSGFWVRIGNTYEYVTDMLHMRTIVRVQLYAYVTVTYVYECHMSNLTRVQTTRTLHILYNCKEKSIQLASVDRMEGDWSELHYLSLILSHITLGSLLCNSNMTAKKGLGYTVTNAVYFMTRLIYDLMYANSRFPSSE